MIDIHKTGDTTAEDKIMTEPGLEFYVQFPVDEYGNSGRSHAVIEAVKENRGDGSFKLSIVAPVSYCDKWPTIVFNGSGYGSWVETEGPARFLMEEEWFSLMARHGWKQDLSGLIREK